METVWNIQPVTVTLVVYKSLEFKNLTFSSKVCDFRLKRLYNLLQNKIPIYEEWVKRLLEEIATLVDCIQEMEKQTAHGLDVLTTNLNMTCLPDERIKALQNDLNATVEIIRRARVFGQWNTDGIKLNYLSFTDVFGDQSQ